MLVLSHHLEARYAMRLLEEAPERVGYLLKERVSDLAVLVDALRRIDEGECVVDPTIVSRLMSARRAQGPLDELTEREREVLALMAEGHSNQGICDALVVSPKTVEGHVRQIFMKLGLREVARAAPSRPGRAGLPALASELKRRPAAAGSGARSGPCGRRRRSAARPARRSSLGETVPRTGAELQRVLEAAPGVVEVLARPVGRVLRAVAAAVGDVPGHAVAAHASRCRTPTCTRRGASW